MAEHVFPDRGGPDDRGAVLPVEVAEASPQVDRGPCRDHELVLLADALDLGREGAAPRVQGVHLQRRLPVGGGDHQRAEQPLEALARDARDVGLDRAERVLRLVVLEDVDVEPAFLDVLDDRAPREGRADDVAEPDERGLIGRDEGHPVGAVPRLAAVVLDDLEGLLPSRAPAAPMSKVVCDAASPARALLVISRSCAFRRAGRLSFLPCLSCSLASRRWDAASAAGRQAHRRGDRACWSNASPAVGSLLPARRASPQGPSS